MARRARHAGTGWRPYVRKVGGRGRRAWKVVVKGKRMEEREVTQGAGRGSPGKENGETLEGRNG